MRPSPLHASLCTAILYLFGLIALQAQDVGSVAGQLWKTGRTDLASGNYAGAEDAFNQIIRTAAKTDTSWLDPVYYNLAICHFKAKDYPGAIEAFNLYLKLYSKSNRVPEATFLLAQSYFNSEQYEQAKPLLDALRVNSRFHDRSVLLLAEADKLSGKPGDAITLLEAELAKPNLTRSFAGKMNIKLLKLYEDASDLDKAATLLQRLDENKDSVAELNPLAIRLGDLFLGAQKTDDALNCYSRVRPNETVIALENERIGVLQNLITANLSRIQSDPLNSAGPQAENRDFQAEIGICQATITEYQNRPPIQAPLFLRIAQAYSGHKWWEAAVVYRELARRYPSVPEAQSALYGMIVAFDRVGQFDSGLNLCSDYLTRFPQGKYFGSVSFLQGAIALQADELDKANDFFIAVLKNQPENPSREQIELALGDVQLRQQKFDDAATCYQKYLKDFPQGHYVEQATYRIVLSQIFAGENDDAKKGLANYLQAYPQGAYAADAEYRIDVLKFAENMNDEVLADSQVWQKKYGTNGPLAEMLALTADVLAAEGKTDDAVKTYIKSYQCARTTDVLNYSLFAAAKLLKKQAKWQDIVTMFQEFIKNNPEHPTAVSATAWVGRADIKLGKVEEAKQFMAAAANRYLNDPSREAVDEIIAELARVCAKKTKADASPTPSPATDPSEELLGLLTIPDLDTKPTAQARRLFAQAELDSLNKRTVDKQQDLLQQISQSFKPEDLSPEILGVVGDFLLAQNAPDKAMPFYNYLLDEFPRSPLVGRAYNGLAQIAFDQKDYATAFTYYSTALDKSQTADKEKELTLGEARTLLALNRLENARKLFEEVASTRAWRGESTAFSVYSLGEIQRRQGKFAEANAYFQRVYVSYQKYPDIQAKSYLGSGEALEKLGKIPEAIDTYREMLQNQRLASFPETQSAQQRLGQLVQK